MYYQHNRNGIPSHADAIWYETHHIPIMNMYTKNKEKEVGFLVPKLSGIKLQPQLSKKHNI